MYNFIKPVALSHHFFLIGAAHDCNVESCRVDSKEAHCIEGDFEAVIYWTNFNLCPIVWRTINFGWTDYCEVDVQLKTKCIFMSKEGNIIHMKQAKIL